MKFFIYDGVNEEVMLNDESILLIREFAALLDESRNTDKKKNGKSNTKRARAFREFKFLFLFFDWSSPYFQYSEQDRHNEALADSGLTQEEYDDPIFRAACRKYDELQNASLDVRLLKAAMMAVENQIYYLEHVDLNERDPQTGKPVFKSKDLIAEIKGSKDIISGLRELEMQVKKGEETANNLRGDAEAGIFD